MTPMDAMALDSSQALECLQRIGEKLARRFPQPPDLIHELMVMIHVDCAHAGDQYFSVNDALSETLWILEELEEDDYFGMREWRSFLLGDGK